jgi:hypothetical protein
MLSLAIHTLFADDKGNYSDVETFLIHSYVQARNAECYIAVASGVSQWI